MLNYSVAELRMTNLRAWQGDLLNYKFNKIKVMGKFYL